MTDPLTLSAALALGIATSGHCVLMCGGITTALAMATARDVPAHTKFGLLAGYQLGRVCSYTIAGLLFAGAVSAVAAAFDLEAVRRSLRLVAAAAFLLAALVTAGVVRDPGSRVGQDLWMRLAPWGRRLLPVTTVPKAVAFGMIWGWMPCGFVYTILLVAALQFGAWRGAATMAAFGIGTIPALLATSLGGQRLSALLRGMAGRRIAAGLLVACAVLTAVGPFLVHSMPFLNGWLPMCSPGS